MKSEEERFFDRHVTDPGQLKIYQQIKDLDFEKPFVEYFDSLLGELSRQVVLEYGCGNYGDLSLKLGRGGARVAAIDLSGESVRSTQRLLERVGLTHQVAVLKMDCEQLGFQDESFDLVVGRAVLHHLDLERSCAEVRRVLKPGGRAVFIEPMGMNPLINLYRRLTPRQHTPGEHPFTYKTIKKMSQYFEQVTHKEFNLFPLIVLATAGLFREKKKLLPALHRLQSLDELAFKYFPCLARYAWTTVISCS